MSSEINDYQKIFHWAETQKDGSIPSFALRRNDLYQYQSGFGNNFESEAIPGTIPRGQNNPRSIRFGLYAEQLTGSAFIAPRSQNKRTWLYRSLPSAAHQGFGNEWINQDMESNFLPINPRVHSSPTHTEWRPFDIPGEEKVDFVSGIKTIAGSGDPTLQEGCATHVYLANSSMANRAFVNCDGDFLIVPQQGALDIQTEFGPLFVQPGEICVIQRGLRYSVRLPDGPSRGYILEIWGTSFELPELGPLGSNSLANPRDFLYPKASYEMDDSVWEIIHKYNGKFFTSSQNHSPFDVVAWAGNYVPYKYDLTKFVYVGSISVDHIDPSIFVVLTARSHTPGTPLVEFLVVGPRWDVASHTYRPQYFHRNVASEIMGLIHGEYWSEDFKPGGLHLDCSTIPHGVPYEVYRMASEQPVLPMRISENILGFMFESCRPFTLAEWAWNNNNRREPGTHLESSFVNSFLKHKKEVERMLARDTNMIS